MQHRNAAAAHQAHATTYILEATACKKVALDTESGIEHHMALPKNMTTRADHWCNCQLDSSISIAGSQVGHMHSAVNWLWGTP